MFAPFAAWRRLVRNRVRSAGGTTRPRKRPGPASRRAAEPLEERVLLAAAPADVGNWSTLSGPNSGSIGVFGEPNTAYYAQSFTAVETGDAGTLTFRMRSADWVGPDATEFRVLLTATTGTGTSIRPTTVLFESGGLSLAAGSAWTTFTVDLGGVDLVAGTTYAWVLDGFAARDGESGAAVVGGENGTTDSYVGGHFFYYNATAGTRADHFAANWTDQTHADLAFRLTYDANNDRPVALPGSLTTDEDTPVSGTLSASDPERDPLTFRVVGGASSGTVTITDPTTGAFVYTPGRNFHGTDSFTYVANDGTSDSDIVTVTITVAAVNDDPVLGKPVDPRVDEGGTLTFRPASADADGDELTFGLVGAPDGATIDPATGTFTWTPGEDQDGSHTFKIVVTDGSGGYAEQTITVIVADVNSDPTLAPIGDRNDGEHRTFAVDLAGSDADRVGGVANGLTYELVSGGQRGMSLDALTGAFRWTPTEAQDGTYVVTFRVSDGVGGFAERTITIVVDEVNGNPDLARPADRSTRPGRSVEFEPTAADQDLVAGRPNTLTYAIGTVTRNGVERTAAGLGMTLDPATGAFTWTPTVAGTFRVTFVVDDGMGGTDAETVTITVESDELSWRFEGGTLFVFGSSGDDAIGLASAGKSKLRLTLNDLPPAMFAGVTRVVVYAFAGDDDVQVAGSLALPTYLFGGEGDDRLKGGNGGDVLIGGDGDDSILGNAGRDLLFGGLGSDRLVGGAGDDLLVAGRTAWDDDPAALSEIMAVWGGPGDFAARAAALRGDGSTDAGLLNDATVFDDAARDLLTGGSGDDWFLFASAGDKATDLKDRSGEAAGDDGPGRSRSGPSHRGGRPNRRPGRG